MTVDLEALARRAGFDVSFIVLLSPQADATRTFVGAPPKNYPREAFARFAALVAEECAKLVEPDSHSTIAESVIGASRARAIRAAFPMPKESS